MLPESSCHAADPSRHRVDEYLYQRMPWARTARRIWCGQAGS